MRHSREATQKVWSVSRHVVTALADLRTEKAYGGTLSSATLSDAFRSCPNCIHHTFVMVFVMLSDAIHHAVIASIPLCYVVQPHMEQDG